MRNALVLAVAFLLACDASVDPSEGVAAGDALSTPSTPAPSAGTSPLTALQKHKAEMLTSIWENGTTVLQYAYCENIQDGRGYTSGRAGFCSGTADAVEVLRCLDSKVGTNATSKYLAPLDALAQAEQQTGENQADTSTLDSVGRYCDDWASADTAPALQQAFRDCQDAEVQTLYFQPALERAAKWGVSTALTLAALYDAEIEHGEDGVDAIIAAANGDVGNGAQRPASAPLALDAESVWLAAVLTRRVQALQEEQAMREGVDRAALYEQLRRNRNFDLSAAIRTTAKAKTLFPGIPGIADSGYPDCTISGAGAVSGDADCTAAKHD